MLAGGSMCSFLLRIQPTGLTRILTRSSTLCCSYSQKKDWQQKNENGEAGVAKEGVLQQRQQKSNGFCYSGDLQRNFRFKEFGYVESTKWRRNNYAKEEGLPFGSVRDSKEDGLEGKLNAGLPKCIISSVLPGNKHRSYRPLNLSVPFCNFNLSSPSQGLFATVLYRELHTLEGKNASIYFKSSATWLWPDSLHGKNGLRHKSSSKSSVLTFHQMCDLVNRCESSKQLLDLIVPWIQKEIISTDISVTVLLQLQNLVYREIRNIYPHMPHENISHMRENLKLLKVVDEVFLEIHDHFSFKKLIEYLNQYAGTLNNSQFSTSFQCLTHLGLSHFHPLMKKLYMRLMSSNKEGYSVIDISNLCGAVRFDHPHIHYIFAAYVVPKLSECLRDLKIELVDLDTFQSLVFLAENMILTQCLQQSEVVLLYSLLHDASTKNDCFDNLDLACRLYRHISRLFPNRYRAKTTTVRRYSELKRSVFEMRRLCAEKIKKKSDELSPLNMKYLADAFFFTSDDVLKPRIEARIDYFLNEIPSLLSLSEIIWIMSYKGRSDIKNKAEIISRFEDLDLPTLFLALRMCHFLLLDLRINEIITKKIIEYQDEICQSEIFLVRCWHYATSLMFNKGIVDTQLELCLQHMFVEKVKTFNGLKSEFVSLLILSFIRQVELQPSALNLLYDIVSKQSTFKILSQQFYFHYLLRTLKFKNCQSWGNGEVFDSLVFNILYKTVLEFQRRLQKDRYIMNEGYAKAMNQLCKDVCLDQVVKANVHKTLTRTDLQLVELPSDWILTLQKDFSRKQRQEYLNNIVSNALQQKDLEFKQWCMLLNYLKNCGYSAGENEELKKTLKIVASKSHSFLPYFLYFVLDCCTIGVDMSSALNLIFKEEYLTGLDQHISGQHEISVKNAICYLNQIACISYPELTVERCRERNYVVFTYNKKMRFWKNYPKSLEYALEMVAGGKSFLAWNVYLDYGLPAWRVLVLDDKNNPVKITRMKLQEVVAQKRYKIVVIKYIITDHEHWTDDLIFNLMLEKGYDVVVVKDTEWQSLRLSAFKDKVKFLRKKIFARSEDPDDTDEFVVNCDNISDRWKNYLAGR